MELNKPYLVKRVADNSGVLHFLPHQGFCYGIEVNKPQLAKRVALKDGVLHYLMSDQKRDDTTGKLILNKPYFAKRAKQNADGSLHYLVNGKWCGEGDPPITMCDCEICCTLYATVQFGQPQEFPNPARFGETFEAELQCNRTFTVSQCIICQDDTAPEDPFLYQKTDQQWGGGSGSYTQSGTLYEWRTVVWASDELNGGPAYPIVYDGWTGKFKVFFAATEWTITPEVGTPSVVCCWEYGVVAEWTDDLFDCYGGWGFYLRNGGCSGTPALGVKYIQTPDIPYPENEGCPEGYTYANPEGTWFDATPTPPSLPGEPCWDSAITHIGCPESSGPLSIYAEYWYCPGVSPCTLPCSCENHSEYLRLAIMDLCSSVTPCATDELFSGYTPTSMDWEVAGCHPASGSADWQGEPCGDTCLFSAGTANIFEGADTTFDENDVPGPVIDFQWCDGEATYWVNGGGISGLIEFALCCMTRDDDTTYMAFYALLTLTCSTGIVQYAYKTRDITITPGDPLTISITSLAPFATAASDPGCECDPPVLSIALHYFRPDGCA